MALGAEGYCHTGTENGPPQTVATKSEAPGCHCMQLHVDLSLHVFKPCKNSVPGNSQNMVKVF